MIPEDVHWADEMTLGCSPVSSRLSEGGAAGGDREQLSTSSKHVCAARCRVDGDAALLSLACRRDQTTP